MHLFIELSVIVGITAVVAGCMRVLRQPLVVGYILSGIVVGPFALDLLKSAEDVELFSKIGISILLFIVGLNLNPDTVKETGKAALLTGLGQVIVTSAIGFGVMKLLGFENLVAIYGAIGLTFGSTIIALKLLSDKGDLNKLYGKIAIGFLLVQDLIATLILLVVSVLGTGIAGGATIGVAFGYLFVKGIIATIVLYLISKFILPKLSTYLATSQELLFLFSIAWGLSMATIFNYLGFSIEIGALIAGVTLSVSSYAFEIGSRMRPLRDFFIVLFFVLLGSQMILTDLPGLLVPAIVLSAFVLIVNPIIVIVLMNLMGYRSRTGFMAGLTVAQVSEFSLILMGLGLSLGHISQSIVSLVTLVAVITIAGSTYMVMYADTIFDKTKNFLKIFQPRKHLKRESKPEANGTEMVIFGYDRVGFDFVRSAEALGTKYLVVDFNPASIKKMQSQGIPFKFGDADDVEFLHEISLSGAKIVVSTIPDFKTNKLLVTQYRRHNQEGIIMVISHDIKEARQLYLEGATYVIMPHYLGAHHASSMLTEHGFNIAEFEKERNKHLIHLAHREQISK